MPSLKPTPEQLANRLNPTPATLQLPANGEVFRLSSNIDPTGSSGIQYRDASGKLSGLSYQDIVHSVQDPSLDAQPGGPATIRNGFTILGRQILKDKYGIDYNQIPERNYNDIGTLEHTGTALTPDALKNLLAQPQPAAGSGNTVVNNTPNAAATPAQIAEQQKNPDFLGGKVAPPAQPAKLPANGSIVDFLNQKGQASDFASRAKLAQEAGIKNYTGTAAQNTALLNSLNQTQGANGNGNPVTTPSGKVGESGALGASASQNTAAVASPANKYANLDPIQKQVQMYTDSYTALGLNTIKNQFDTFTKQLGEVQKEMQDKIGKVQVNPWLSQGVSDRTVERIQKEYASRIDMLTHLQTLTDSMYKTGLAQVDHLVSNANADIKATNELAQKQIDAANALAKDNQVVSVGGREVLVNKQTGKTVADLGPTTHFSVAGSGLSADAQALLAQSFLNTGTLPGLGIGGATAKTAILNKAALLAQNQGLTGNDLSLQQANFKANSAALGKITAQKNLVLAFEKTANANLAIVDSLAQKTTAGGIPVINKWLQAGRTGILGNADVSKYNAAIQTAVNEYAKVVSSVTGGQVTSDSARHEVMGLLNNAQTAQQVREVIQLMQTDMKNRENGYNAQIADLKNQMLNKPAGNNSSGSTYNGIVLPH